jgi:stage V sporulation protein G
LVYGRYHRFLRSHRPSSWMRSKSQIVGESDSPSRSDHIRVGMNMQVTEVRILRTKKASVKARATICFDNCFLVRELKVIKGPAGLSFPTKNLSNGTRWDIAFPVDAETRNVIEQAVLAEYEKVIAQADQKLSEKK